MFYLLQSDFCSGRFELRREPRGILANRCRVFSIEGAPSIDPWPPYAETERFLHRLDDAILLAPTSVSSTSLVDPFLGRRRTAGRTGDGDRRCQSCPLLLNRFHKRVEFKNGHLLDCFDYLFLIHN